MNQGEQTWAKGWRAVLICKTCEARIWSVKVGQLRECKCENANYIIDSPHNFEHGHHKGDYDLVLQKVEQAY